MNNGRLAAFVFLKICGWASYDITAVLASKIEEPVAPVMMEYLSNIFGALADGAAVILIAIALIKWLHNHRPNRRPKPKKS